MPQGQQFVDLQSSANTISVRNQAGLVAARTGTTDTAVLSWAAGVVTVNADAIEAVQTAANGTVIRVRTPGRYRAEIGLIKVADADNPITFGFSRDVVAGGLAAVPSFATSGMLAAQAVAAPAAAVVSPPWNYSTEVQVSQAQARQVVGGVQGVLLRFHAFGAAAAPAAGLSQAGWYMVERVGDSDN